jgi:hypothetical protein
MRYSGRGDGLPKPFKIMTTKQTLMPIMAVIHGGGATFAYQPIGGSSIYIMMGVTHTQFGPRYFRQQEAGPWGNTALIAQSKEVSNDQWKPLMDEAISESYKLVAFLEGNNRDGWSAPIADHRDVAEG